MKASLKKKKGQNTAEYILLLALVCGGAIGVFSVFGGTIQGMLVNITSAFTGQGASDANRKKMEEMSKKSSERVGSLKDLQNVETSNPFAEGEGTATP